MFKLFFYVLISLNLTAQTEQKNPKKSTEIEPYRLNAYMPISLVKDHYKAIRADGPIQDIHLDNSGTLWLLTHTNIWSWNLDTNSLTKVDLKTTNSTNSFQKFILFDDKFWITTSTQLYVYLKDGTESFVSQSLESSTTKQLAKWDDQLYWLRDHDSQSINKSNQDLSHIELSKSLFTAHSMGVAKEAQIFVFNKQNINIFDEKDNLLQEVPVDSGSQLIAADIQPATHAFMFNKGLVEIYKVNEEKVIRMLLSEKEPTNVQKLQYNNSFLIYLTDGQVYAFKIL